MNLEEAVIMVLNAKREMSEQSLMGADVIRENYPASGVKRIDLIRRMDRIAAK